MGDDPHKEGRLLMGRASVGSRNRRRYDKGKRIKDKVTGEKIRKTQRRLRHKNKSVKSKREEEII